MEEIWAIVKERGTTEGKEVDEGGRQTVNRGNSKTLDWRLSVSRTLGGVAFVGIYVPLIVWEADRRRDLLPLPCWKVGVVEEGKEIFYKRERQGCRQGSF